MPIVSLVDDVEAPESEEQVHLDAFAEGGVGEDEAGVGHVEVALGANDGQPCPGRRLVVERRDDHVGHRDLLLFVVNWLI